MSEMMGHPTSHVFEAAANCLDASNDGARAEAEDIMDTIGSSQPRTFMAIFRKPKIQHKTTQSLRIRLISLALTMFSTQQISDIYRRRNPPRTARPGSVRDRPLRQQIEELARRTPRFLFSAGRIVDGMNCIEPALIDRAQRPTDLRKLSREELTISLNDHAGHDLFTSWTPSLRDAFSEALRLASLDVEGLQRVYLAVIDTKDLSNDVVNGHGLADLLRVTCESLQPFLVYGIISGHEVRAVKLDQTLKPFPDSNLPLCLICTSRFSDLPIEDAVTLAIQLGTLFGDKFALSVATMAIALFSTESRSGFYSEHNGIKNAVVSAFGRFDVPSEWKQDPAIMTGLTDFAEHPDAARGRLLLQTLVEANYGRSNDSMSMKSVQTALPAVQHMHHNLDTPDPLRQSLSRLPPHHLINTLQHSGHNTEVLYEHDPNAFNVELRYPSGYTERFCLSRKARVLRGKNAPALTPLEDLLRTVQILQTHMDCPETVIANTQMRLETALKHNSQLLFQEQLDSVGAMLMSGRMSLTQLPGDLVHLFFDQLYDRAVAPYVNVLKAGKADNVYGEMRPAFLSRILRQLNVNKNSVYLDLGSGVGNTVMQAALETGCEAHGMEREAFPHLISAFHLQQFHARAVLWGLYPGQVSLHFGDFLQSQLIRGLLRDVDAVLINNVKFGPDTDAKLYDMLSSELRIGAKVFSMRPLKLMGRASKQDPMFRVEQFEYEEGCVSWTDSGGRYHISTRENMGP